MKWFFLLFCFLRCLSLKCQLNESDTMRFSLRLSATGSYQEGNVQVLTLRSRADALYAPTKAWVLKSQNSSLYQTFGKIKADADVFSRNYLYYKPTGKIYPFAIAYVSTNYRRKVDSRYFIGAGATWQMIQAKQHTLKLSAAAVYESTKFAADRYNETKYNGQAKIALWRGSFYFAGWHHLFANRLRLYYDAFWQPGFNNNNNYRLQADAGVDVPLWKGLSFTAAYTFTHENIVVEKIKKIDKLLTFGLSYTFRQP